MKSFYTILFCMAWCSIMNAQQLEVLNSGGGYLENANGSITFSIGEVVIETITLGELCFTQGFCQANVTITALSQMPDLEYDLLAYPNPTNNYVILKIGRELVTNLKYLLYDKSGRLLEMKDITSNESIIPFNFLIPSTYFLKVIDNQLEVKVFKIVKVN